MKTYHYRVSVTHEFDVYANSTEDADERVNEYIKSGSFENELSDLVWAGIDLVGIE